ncbi:uncharacterized protein [Onthophagus taurus]|uniref:uncharacterized protein n=1 Tax=Onthophagus taurus TaxID=166361 RepID=UPI000C1FDA93|nr:uncharacterized protein LOC111426475 [Onthophagus taurus]
MLKYLTILIVAIIFEYVSGHGMMVNPAGRSSVWRFYSGYPANYNDNANYCGGRGLFVSSGGQCGVCGDPYTDAHPQANENTGKFGNGKITGTYRSGQVIDVSITLTANHMGHFTYSLCPLSNPSTYESGENCFIPLKLEDGTDKHYITSSQFNIVSRVRLPAGLRCSRCTLRWNYKVANSWGYCEDGTGRLGCGLQETFRACADISII